MFLNDIDHADHFLKIPADIYFLNVNNENTKKSVKFLQC